MPYSKHSVDLTGQRFGYLVALERDGRLHTTYGTVLALWRCRCDCGQEVTVWARKLRSGKKKACGVAGHRYKPKKAEGFIAQHLAEYRSWRSMWERCTGSTPKHVRNYKARGIKVCERWKKFSAFFEDMGQKPTSKHTIDRYPNNDGNYEPGNCRWATSKEQSRNTRRSVFVEFRGERMLLLDLANEVGLSYYLIRKRLKDGWSLADTLGIPARERADRKRVYVTYDGERLPLLSLVQRFGLSYPVVYGRIRNGWTVVAAISHPVRVKKRKAK